MNDLKMSAGVEYEHTKTITVGCMRHFPWCQFFEKYCVSENAIAFFWSINSNIKVSLTDFSLKSMNCENSEELVQLSDNWKK